MAVKSQVVNDKYAIYNGDCIEGMQKLPKDSVHFSVYSPPFGGLYHYSSSEKDLSNNLSYEQFFGHYEYCVAEIARVTLPGRCTAVHCMDVPASNSGKDWYIDFPGDIIRLHEKHGMHMVARHTIWKEPLWVRNRTMTKNLSHRTTVDDSVYAGVAGADYLIVFRNKGENKIPVTHPTGFDYYAGESPMPAEILPYRGWTGDQKQNRYSHWIWRRYASSIWDDIRMGHVLPYEGAKEEDDEKHVHPLQLDVIERAVNLRSNPGEVVLTPFLGVGSEAYGAVILGRKAVGFELKTSYYRQAERNLEYAAKNGRIQEKQMSDLFEKEEMM